MKRSFHGGMKRKVLVGITVALTGLMPVMAQAANKLIVKDSTGTTDKMVVTDQGYVGINNSTPTSPLIIQGNGDPLTTSVFIANNGRATGYLPTDSPGLNFFRNNDPTVNNGLPRDKDRLGYFAFGSTVFGAKRYTSSFQSFAEGVWSSTSLPTNFTISTTAPGTAFSSERFRIAASGNVGIGTTAPTQKLEINGGLRLWSSTVKPTTCDATLRGTLWFVQGMTAGVADSLEVCAKDAAGNYAWHALY